MAIKSRKSRKSGKTEKKGFFSKIKDFFGNIFAELKRVSWPDKKKLRQNTTTVLVIILLAMAVIFVFDRTINTSLTAVGFYHHKGDQTADKLKDAIDEAAKTAETTTTTTTTSESGK